MVSKFEHTGSLRLKPGRRTKPVDVTAVESIATALEEGSSCGAGSCSARGIAKTLEMAVNKLNKILRKIMQCYLYRIIHVQELLPAVLPKQQHFALEHLVCM